MADDDGGALTDLAKEISGYPVRGRQRARAPTRGGSARQRWSASVVGLGMVDVARTRVRRWLVGAQGRRGRESACVGGEEGCGKMARRKEKRLDDCAQVDGKARAVARGEGGSGLGLVAGSRSR